jgi:hypothetical protein
MLFVALAAEPSMFPSRRATGTAVSSCIAALWANVRFCRGASACGQFVDVTVRSAEVLPGWSRFTEQLDACTAQFLDGRGHVADCETEDGSAFEVLLPWN